MHFFPISILFFSLQIVDIIIFAGYIYFALVSLLKTSLQFINVEIFPIYYKISKLEF